MAIPLKDIPGGNEVSETKDRIHRYISILNLIKNLHPLKE